MARYYFHIRDHGRLILDEDGLELPTDTEALAEAKAGARDLINDAALDGDDIAHQVMEIVTQDGRLVGTVPLLEQMTIRHDG